MQEFSLAFLRCIRCGGKLEVEVFKKNKEIDEGFLECQKCILFFPIIDTIPIIWDDFSNYAKERPRLVGKFFNSASNSKLKIFLRSSLENTKRTENDRSLIEERWANIYLKSKHSKFYKIIKNKLDDLPQSKLALEHGCSIGIMSTFLAKNHQTVFGIDKSFYAIQIAKKTSRPNLDYFVADSLSPLFGKTKFDLVLALNVMELIEPIELLDVMSAQLGPGYLIISDPYDFDRGIHSVKKPINEISLREILKKKRFKFLNKTTNPSFLPWNLKINPRSFLNYKIDLVICKKILAN